MSVSKEEVQYLAHLARLQLTEEETERLSGDMNRILEYMEQLQEPDTEDVEPLEHVIDMEYRLRDDTPEEPLSHEDALKNAPDADSDYFRVPRVIE